MIPLSEEQIQNIKEELKNIRNIIIENRPVNEIITEIVNKKVKLSEILDIVIQNKTYWTNKKNKLESTFEYVLNKAKLEDPDTKMNAEQKKAWATIKACEIISQKMFNGENYIQKTLEIEEQLVKANYLYDEVNRLYHMLSEIIIAMGIIQKNQNQISIQ